jgi:hypothetical protein
MKKTITAVLLSSLVISAAYADTYVNGYNRRDGTYVQGHYRTDANSTYNDNYSTRGNYNPYTGEAGYRPRDEDWNANGYYGYHNRY